MNKFLHGIYTVTIFTNGSFCWEVSYREKNIDDYKAESFRQFVIISIMSAIIVISSLG